MNSGWVTAAWLRMGVAALAGVATGVLAGLTVHTASAAMLGWIAAGLVFNAWTWLAIGRMDADATQSHATREDPSRTAGHVIAVLASVLAIVGVGVLVAASSSKKGGAPIEALIGVGAVAASWFTVHTLFTLRYARLYFDGEPGGIDFNAEDEPDIVPTYRDFAYLGFTVGMTYQVSDTSIKSAAIRHAILRHALLSFLLGAVVLAATINLVSQLASSGG